MLCTEQRSWTNEYSTQWWWSHLMLVSHLRFDLMIFFVTPPWLHASPLKIGGIHQLSVSAWDFAARNEASFPAAKSQKKIGRNELKIPLLGPPVTVSRDLVSSHCKDRPFNLFTGDAQLFFFRLSRCCSGTTSSSWVRWRLGWINCSSWATS